LRHLNRLKGLTQLKHLVLAGNPIADNPRYRELVIAAFPNLQTLDFCRLTDETPLPTSQIGTKRATLADLASRDEELRPQAPPQPSAAEVVIAAAERDMQRARVAASAVVAAALGQEQDDGLL
jgi:hypothetical protein